MKKGKLLAEKPCETLRQQYEKVFSTSLDCCKVQDPKTFFMHGLDCMDCANKITHICPLDLEPNSQYWNLHNVDKIQINPKIIRNIVEKLEPTIASGPDGIPAILLKKCASSFLKL